MGPLVVDIAGTSLCGSDKKLLANPLVGGIILFARNYVNSLQLQALTLSIRQLRQDIIIAVDHEGGRVQRFKDGFTRIPAMGEIRSVKHAFACGVVMAYELKMHGLNLSFAPVLDRDLSSEVIGDRGFSRDNRIIVKYANALVEGMYAMNFPSCAKHFPGHGSVAADSHIACPVDERDYTAIAEDIAPFANLIKKRKVDAIMPAHVVYSQCDTYPAGYSDFWLQQELRIKCGFNGVIFSDDLSMKGATVGGSYAERAKKAYAAGCDFLLVCNAPEEVCGVIEALKGTEFRAVTLPHRFFSPLPDNAKGMYERQVSVLKESADG